MISQCFQNVSYQVCNIDLCVNNHSAGFGLQSKETVVAQGVRMLLWAEVYFCWWDAGVINEALKHTSFILS